ncbi:NHLP bacteriocin export ABC transporter permease/ATPase subunit [Kitasatospora camelliae]|uniref:NHLP bacteriocin export ABC transporter permease/ATPase subunit n=1 Tax=Kitasatospora camelliae TaxID=3156397 RepID=A0AAU8JN22_9ACTN
MTSVHPSVADGTGPDDTVLDALGELGTPLEYATARGLALEGPQVLWLIAEGAMDLFAVDAVRQGRWHFLGRLSAGTLLLGPVDGPRHTLLGRPLQGCVLRRIRLGELVRSDDADTGANRGPGGGLGLLEDAFARGIGHGLRVLFEAPAGGRPEQAPGQFAAGARESADEGVAWVSVAPGSLRHGGAFDGQSTGDLLIDGAVWHRLVDQQTRLLFALDRWIDRSERVHEDRAAAGIKAGEAVRAQADRALLASIGTSGEAPADVPAGSDDAALAVCRLVAGAAGIAVTAPTGDGASGDRLGAVQRIALSSRLRTRAVGLTGRWWRENAGPLVGRRAGSGTPVALLWRRGRYEAVDPARGTRSRIDRANADEFEPWAVMFYRPLPQQPLTAWRLLRFAMRGAGTDLRNLVLGGLVAVVLGAMVPIATGRILGDYVPNAETGLIVQTSLAIVATAVVGAAFMLMENISIVRIEGRLEATLQPAVWDRLLRLPARFFAERSTGELATAAMGISGIRRVLSGTGSVIVHAVTVGTVNLVLLLWYSLPLALVALAVLVVLGAVSLGLGLRQLRWQRRLTVLHNKLNNQAFQTLRALPKLRVAAAESFAYAAWAGEFARSRELQRRVGRIKNLITVCDAVGLPLCTLIVFMLLAGPARGALSPSGFLTFNTAVTMMLVSMTQLTGALVSTASVLPMFEQLKPVLDEAPEVRGGSTAPGTLSGAIEARALSFRYTEDGPLVLDDVSLRIPPGEFVAVVGASGCGKSTLLRLLIGFDRPALGSVLYDGQDLATLDQAAVRRQCGVVLQDAQPFAGSILDCLRGTGTYSLEEAWAAAEMAGLAEDVKRMPMGMHTVLSDSGATVSGGQRQRLMIAQALIRRPRILFFDEATSALDNETQRVVIDSTRTLRCTRIVIAHRLSTVLDADRVIVMAEGRIVQQGPPARLLADTDGLFHELVRRQIR